MKKFTTSKLMKAQILTKHGSLDSYKYTLVDKPILNENDKNMAIVKVLRCSINNTDIWTREGAYSKDGSSGWQELNFPIIQGADVCGILEHTNDNLQNKLVGKKVLVNPTIYPDESLGDDIQNITHCKYLGSELNGGYSEFIKVPFQNLHFIPDTCNLTVEQLSCIPTAYATAYHMIKRIPNSLEKKTCLISGVSGGVGMALMQLLNYLYKDIKLIGITSEDKINSLEFNNLISRNQSIKEIKNAILKIAKNVDVVFDVVAGEYVDLFIDVLKTNGDYVCSGAIGNRNVSVYWPNFYLKHLNFYGSMLATHQDFKELTEIVFSNKIQPIVNSVYNLENLESAQNEFTNKKFIGKIILNCEN